MATAFANARGQYSIQYRQPGQRRPTIYLGKVSAKFADDFCKRVQHLLDCQKYAHPLDAQLLAWLSSLPPKVKAKLADKGLIDPVGGSTVAELCRYCIEQAHVEPSSLQKYRDAEANLVAFFTGSRNIQSITSGDADEFARWLRKKGRRPKEGTLAATTVSKRLQQVKQFFAVAVRKRWIPANPLDGVTVPLDSPTDRQFFVTTEMTTKLMKAADPELRVIIALARYGGLRIPSEIWPLEWDWVNWEEGTLKVFSQKNKRFAHMKWRSVPLFPELAKALSAAYMQPEGSRYIIRTRPGDITATALRNRLERLCLKCKIMPWPKLWQNMRSTRETELIDQGYPIHVVCAWIGNSPAVAIRSYLQIVKEHVRRATGVDRDSAALRKYAEKALSKSLSKALTNADQKALRG